VIIINDIELDFDITSPSDVKRYKDAPKQGRETGRELI